VTAFVPTIVTSAPLQRESALAALAALEPHQDSATALGLHFEGPLISPARPGAHDLDHIGFPPIAEFDSWTRARGLAIVTLAPELAGVTELIARLVAAGVVVSAGHTACSAPEFGVARAAGVTMVTHLFNAMAPFSHRDPGPIGAALADGDVYAGLICDGIHADPVAVRMAWRALGPDHTILVTDAVAALGLGAGTVRLGRHTLAISDRGVRNTAGVLAGSNLSLDRAVRNLVQFSGCSPAQAIRAASANPAALLGLEDRGRIEVGAIADLVVFSQDLEVERTIIGGHTAWKS
jgi:N-acetylglucosamine-6-phosphate deacetylase